MAQAATRLRLTARENVVSPTFFLLVASMMGYGFGYLYLILMGRMLGPDLSGIVGSLVAIFYVACLVGQGLREAIATNVAEIKSRQGEGAAVSAFRKFGVKLGLLSVLPGLACIAASGPIARFFHMDSIGPVVLLGCSLTTALLLDILLGLLQGLQAFIGFGFLGFLTSQGLKLLLGVAFVWVGWDLYGAVGALLASTGMSAAIGWFIVRTYLTRNHRPVDAPHPHLAPVLLPTLLLAVFMAMPTSVDQMLVTHFFNSDDSGVYYAAATLGKVVMFLPMPISFVLLPKAVERHALGLSSGRFLARSLAGALLLSGGVALVCGFARGHIIKLFFGPEYAEAGDIVGWYGMAMVLFSVNFVLIHYSLAIRSMKMMLWADLVTLAEILAIALVHASLSQVIWVLIVGNLILLLGSTAILGFAGKRV